MATKPTKFQNNYPPTTWVSCDLTEPQRKHVKSLKTTPEQVLDGVSRLVDDGYKLSVSKDAVHDCVAAFLTAPKEKAEDRTICLSSRGPSAFNALVVLLYKHFEILQGDWSGKEKSGTIDPWG